MSEDKLEKEMEIYKDLAKQDKKIDVTSLMINALQAHQGNLLSPKQKRWAYIIALTFPPVGLFFAFKFYFSGKDDAKEAAIMCVVLTAVSILLLVILGAALLGGSGTSLNQIQQIKPSDIQQLYQ